MTLVKKIAKLTAATLFTLFLTLFVILLFVYDLTSYSTMKAISSAQFSEQIKQLQETCKNYPTAEFDVQGEKFSCSQISELDAFATKIFDKNYYKAYNCSILECAKQPTTFFSAFGNNLVWSTILASLVLSLIFGILLVLLLEKKIKGIGYSLIIVGINSPLLFFAKNIIPTTGMAAIDTFINNIFGQTIWNFLLILVAGIVLVAIGLYTKK